MNEAEPEYLQSNFYCRSASDFGGKFSPGIERGFRLRFTDKGGDFPVHWRLTMRSLSHSVTKTKPVPRKLEPSDYEPYVDPIGVTFWLPPKCKGCDD